MIKKVLKRNFCLEGILKNLVYRESVRFVNQRNMMNGYPAQEFMQDVEEGDRVKINGENSVFLENDTKIEISRKMKISHFFNSWPESYLVCLRVFEVSEVDLNPDEANELKEDLNKNFKDLTFKNYIEKIEKNLPSSTT